MYNPYVRKGEWLDCDKCGSPHRRILSTDLENYITADGSPVVLTEEESTRCYSCEPLNLFFLFECKSCNESSIVGTLYGDSRTKICPKCGFDHNESRNVGPAFVESRPKLDSDMKYVLNRIKKNHYNSTMPDY